MFDVQWSDLETDVPGASTRDFRLRHAGGDVPGALWLPTADAPKALILAGHGGSKHKRAASVLTFANLVTERLGFAVATIDGPVHGARRAPDCRLTPKEIQAEFLTLWKRDHASIATMTRDWQATLSMLLTMAPLADLKVGWYGLSMGTAYGLPFVAAERRIGAAVLGMWGSNYPNSEPLVAAAPKVACPVLFMHKTEDELFTFDGAMEIYNAFPNRDKRMLLMPGPHADANQEQLDAALGFFAERLAGD